MYNYFLLLACLLVFLSCDSQSRQEKSTSDISAERLRAIIKDRPPLPYAPEAYTLTEPLNDLVARRQALLDTLAQLKSDTVPIMTDTSFARYERDILVRELKTKVAIYRDRIAMEMLSICGPTADFQHVESYHPTQGIPATLVNRCCNSIGLLQWKQDFRHVTGITDKGNVSGLGWGSGSLIADDLFLTAGHCFAPDNSGHRFPTRNGIVLEPRELAPLMEVKFNFQRIRNSNSLRPDTLTFPVVALEEIRFGYLDYAIIRLGRNGQRLLPGDYFNPLRVSAQPADREEQICIIQHPKGGPKVITCGRINSVVNTMMSYNAIDTEYGSSGAPIISASKNAVIGVHVDGLCNANGTESNSATLITAILPHSPLLRRIIR